MTLQILRAVYASSRKGVDVTARCQQLVDGGQWPLNPGRGVFPDPDPGQQKCFMIQYLSPGHNNGQPISLGALDEESLVPPLNYTAPPGMPPPISLAPTPQAQVTITQAVFGSPYGAMDVTAQCQSIANQGQPSFAIMATVETFGFDPSPGWKKVLVVQYQTMGQTLNLGSVEGGSVTLNAVPPPLPLDNYQTGQPFQLGWCNDGSTLIVQVPVVGSHVIATKQQPGPNNGLNTWVQKHPNGRLYLLNASGKPTRYCLEAALGGQFQGDGNYPPANGCLVILNQDIPQRQTQLWNLSPAAGSSGYTVQNTGISLSLTQGPSAGPYVLDSGGGAGPGTLCQLWQAYTGSPHQSWLLLAPPT